MKNAIIFSAQNSGYFRSKKDDVKMAIMDELLTMADFAEVERSEIEATLQAETLRRHVVYQTRAKRAIEKASKDAAKPISAGVDSAFSHVQEMPPGKYVLTTAQNNTDIDSAFFGALLNYCEANDATLLIAKSTYNKNGFLQNPEDIEGVYYAPEVLPYLVEGHISLGACDFIAAANVSPTAKNPLSGFEAITPAGINAIIPTCQIALKCVAALKGAKVKLLFGTGAVTKRNYILRKVGAIAATYHNIGAVFVDTTNGGFTARQLERVGESDGFYDENRYYSSEGVKGVVSPAVLQLGDIHAEKLTEENMAKVENILSRYNPDNIMLHDVCDFSSRNHHNIKDNAFMFEQMYKGNTVKGDLNSVTRFIDTIMRKCNANVHIIESNHDLALEKWVKETDFKDDPVNALVYLQCTLAMYQHIQAYKPFNMLEFAYKEICKGEYSPVFHSTDESVIIAGIEHGCHGHTGINGSRGSPVQFRALGVPMNTGHTHTPSINGAVYTAGVTGSLEMGYNIGASSWQLASIVTWPNGQRQIIFM